MEAADAGIKVIVCITEGIPVADMTKVKNYIADKDCRLVDLTVQVSSLLMKLRLVLCQDLYSRR